MYSGIIKNITANPAKAGITKDIEKYRWSSYTEYLDTPIMTDVDFALDMFSTDRNKAVDLFKSYNNENNDDQCMEYAAKLNLSDQEVIEFLNELGFVNLSEITRLEKGQRDQVIKKIKNINGVNIRQIARLTGISKSVIDRI